MGYNLADRITYLSSSLYSAGDYSLAIASNKGSLFLSFRETKKEG
jgi:hypothetical protein